MTPWIIAQAVCCSVLVLEGILLVWRYHVRLGRLARLQTFQYRFFALRDKAIRLVGEGQAREEDPNWQAVYRLLNEMAKAAFVSRMQNGLSFVLHLLQKAPPEKRSPSDWISVREPLASLVVELANTVVDVCFEGSLVLRWAVKLSSRFDSLKRLLEKRRPVEVRNFRLWKICTKQLSWPVGAGSTPMH
jgi:hypothetical protein